MTQPNFSAVAEHDFMQLLVNYLDLLCGTRLSSGTFSATRTGIIGMESHHSFSRRLPWLFSRRLASLEFMMKMYKTIPRKINLNGITATTIANPESATITMSACCNLNSMKKTLEQWWLGQNHLLPHRLIPWEPWKPIWTTFSELLCWLPATSPEKLKTHIELTLCCPL